ncbi:MAG: LemA family protein, partial [Gammaproteobacteria bacterium]
MGLLFWSIILGIISMLIIIANCYNEIIRNKNSIIRSWADIITYERQKNNILTQLGSIIKDYQKYEHDLQIKITELRGSLNKIKPDELNNKILKEVEDQTQVLMKGIKVALENYPDLKT